VIEPSPLRHADLFHTGIVVDDLDAAKEHFGALLGLTWLEGGGETRMLTDDGARTVQTAYALSAEGPHHVELVQSVPGTLYTVTGAARAHHLGYWVDDVAATSAALAEGMPTAASFAVQDDAPPICAYHQAGAGFYVELVSRAMRRVLLRDT
jgi:catechol 2,3-dioxygenase-like lactoylglutathione lyase family enzyme